MKLPFIKWFPNDWLADPSVRTLSLAGRGLWMDMLSLMHLSPRRGYLLAATGSPITPEQLARLTGCSADEATRLLAELTSSGACSCTDDGIFFSRRMVREEGKRELCSEAGRKGGGNPALKNGTFKGHSKGGSKGAPKGGPKPLEARGQTLDPSSSAGDPPERGDQAAKPRKPRPRNPLFDAIAEVTRTDPEASGSFVGSVAAVLAKATPPYTPDDVREFAARLAEFCPWAAKDRRTHPELGELQKHIGKLRASKAERNGASKVSPMLLLSSQETRFEE